MYILTLNCTVMYLLSLHHPSHLYALCHCTALNFTKCDRLHKTVIYNISLHYTTLTSFTLCCPVPYQMQYPAIHNHINCVTYSCAAVKTIKHRKNSDIQCRAPLQRWLQKQHFCFILCLNMALVSTKFLEQNLMEDKPVIENHNFQDKSCYNFVEVVPGCDFQILCKSFDSFLEFSQIAKTFFF